MATETDSHMTQSPSEETQASTKKPGPIIVARHGRPALDRAAGPRLSWQEYKDWWARYEIGSLAEGQEAPQKLKDIVADSDVSVSRPVIIRNTMSSIRYL